MAQKYEKLSTLFLVLYLQLVHVFSVCRGCHWQLCRCHEPCEPALQAFPFHCIGQSFLDAFVSIAFSMGQHGMSEAPWIPDDEQLVRAWPCPMDGTNARFAAACL